MKEFKITTEDTGRLNDIKFIRHTSIKPSREPVYLIIAKHQGKEYQMAVLTAEALIQKIRELTGETSNHQLLAVIVSH
jgi:hypothetical protein